jgi:alanine dehydrogenase
MIIGIPKEIKNNENRVAITPAGVQSLVNHGHTVLIETNAGHGSGISDDEYVSAGGKITDIAKALFDSSDMIMKVKEPLAQEWPLFKEGQILFTYLHLAPEPELTHALLEKKIVGIAYETVQLDDGTLPLLTPMSEVAGRMAVQIGAQYLEKPKGGKGILLGGVPGVPAADVTIIGGGVVGTNAAKMAIGLGAQVTIIDKSADRLRYLDDIFGSRIRTLMSNTFNVAAAVKNADLLVGAVLIPGAKCPKIVTEQMIKAMKPGSVVVDVAIDQGGCIETIDRVTTHSDPTYTKHNVIHYAVANIPGAVARTSTFALTNVTLPYAIKLADNGLDAVNSDLALKRGVNVVYGSCTCEPVAQSLELKYRPLESVLV